MGNCLHGGFGEADDQPIKVITSSSGIMEFSAAITPGSICQEFPGHAVFQSHDLFSKPIPHGEQLFPGNSYFLLPLDSRVRQGHVRSKSIPSSVARPYRMSLDYHHQGASRRSHTEQLWRKEGENGVLWKVRLVISQEQLVEILSQETRTEELIESLRTVAKCGNGSWPPHNSSHRSTLSSTSRNRIDASSKPDGLPLLDI